MKSIILLLFVAFSFTACSRYDYYWHQEEDDVYFISKTPEEVDIYTSVSKDDDDNEYDTYDSTRTPRRTRDYDPYPRRNRNSTIYYPSRRRTRTVTTRPSDNRTIDNDRPASKPRSSTPSRPRPRPRTNPTKPQ